MALRIYPKSTMTTQTSSSSQSDGPVDIDGDRPSRPSYALRKALSVGWKVALMLAIAAFITYRMRFAPVPVQSHVATVGPIASEVMGTGTLEARVQTTISPRVSGLISDILADQGDRIAKGELLTTLYDADVRQQLEMAKAELAAVEAGVDRSAADIARAQANAKQARLSHDRMAKLVEAQAVSAELFEKATQELEVANAELRRAELAKVELERQVTKAAETVRYYDARLTDTRITSPFDGLVTRRSREPGDVVVPGSEILQIISTERMWVSAWVDETAMSSLSVDQPARVVFRSEPQRTYSGTLTRLAPLADRETREFRVDVTISELPNRWALGQRAEVYIQTAARDAAVLAPPSAIVWRDGKPGLFVSDAGHAQWRNVTLGLRSNQAVEILDGLSVGEQVIWSADSQNPLVEGRAVAARTP